MKLKVVSSLILFALTFTSFAKDFKGAEIYSKDSVLYGRFEMSIKSAPGSGQLSTFFLYRYESETPTTLWQEIDLEIFGKDTNVFQTNVIVEEKEGTRKLTEVKHTTDVNLHTSFNTYAIEWTPDSISWFFNDEFIRSEKVNAQFCNAPMSIRFNHWAANITSWVGKFDKTVLPQEQQVEYLSYSSYTPGTGDNDTDFTFQWQDDFTSLSSTRWAKANWTFGENLCDFKPENAYTENDVLVLKITDESPIVIPTSTELISTQFNVYPNPSKGNVYLNFDVEGDFYISMSNINGFTVLPILPLNSDANDNLNRILQLQTPGLYILKVYDQNNSIVASKTLVKQ